jgi:hypothetical protein
MREVYEYWEEKAFRFYQEPEDFNWADDEPDEGDDFDLDRYGEEFYKVDQDDSYFNESQVQDPVSGLVNPEENQSILGVKSSKSSETLRGELQALLLSLTEKSKASSTSEVPAASPAQPGPKRRRRPKNKRKPKSSQKTSGNMPGLRVEQKQN